jgi:hypothetical protein
MRCMDRDPNYQKFLSNNDRSKLLKPNRLEAITNQAIEKCNFKLYEERTIAYKFFEDTKKIMTGSSKILEW